MRQKGRLIRMLLPTLCFLCGNVVGQVRPSVRPKVNHVLVRTEVTSVEIKGEKRIVTLEITHVYKGPKELVGREFGMASDRPDMYRPDMQDISRSKRLQLRQVGEVNIWAFGLKKDGITLVLGAKGRLVFGAIWPVRKGISPRYEELETFAKTIERVGAAPPAKQVTMWREQVLSPIPEISLYAMRQTAELGGPQSEKFLESLIENPRLTVSAQVILEGILTDMKEQEWLESWERTSLLARWMAEASNPTESQVAINALHRRWQTNKLSSGQLVKLARVFVFNEALPATVRSGASLASFQSNTCMMMVGIMAQRNQKPGDAELAFSFFVDVIRTSREPEIRMKAASCIRAYVWATPERVEVMKKLRDELKDPKLISILNDAINR